MPELPEVELAAEYLRSALGGRRIARVELETSARTPALDPLRGVEGLVLAEVRRHGKQLALDFETDLTFFLHLGMTARFAPVDEGAAPAHSRFVLWSERDVGVAFVDPRRFARHSFCPTSRAARDPTWCRLGPDALAADLDAWCAALRGTGTVKSVLLDQHRLAGVGNIYACEGLWAAGLDPQTPAVTLTPDDIERLRAAVRAAMHETLARERGSNMRYLNEGNVSNPFRIYGREGEPCPGCGRPILRFTQAGRSTWCCATCQPARTPAAGPAVPRKARSRRVSPAP